MKEHNCLQCGAVMSITFSFKNKKAKAGVNKYRVKRWACSLCEYSELVIASGQGDKEFTEAAVEEAKEYYFL